jgi:hypothetical protein
MLDCVHPTYWLASNSSRNVWYYCVAPELSTLPATNRLSLLFDIENLLSWVVSFQWLDTCARSLGDRAYNNGLTISKKTVTRSNNIFSERWKRLLLSRDVMMVSGKK